MQRFAKGDQNAQKEISKQAQGARDEQEALRRVIQGKEADQSEDSEAVDLSDSDNDGNDGVGKKGLGQRTVDKAKKLTLSELNDLKNGGELPTTGLLGLGFMRNAIRQKREVAKAEAQTVLNELEGLGARLDGTGAKDSDVDGSDEEKADKRESAAPQQKRRDFSAEELEQASKEVDTMLEMEDVTQSQGMSVSGPLTVRGVEAQPLPQGSAQKATARSISAPAAQPSRSKGATSSSAESKAPLESNPWLADAEENPWTATAGADAATPASSSTVAVDANNAKRKGAAASAEPTSKRKRRRGVKDAVADEVDDAEAEPVASTSERLNLLDADANAAREQRDLVRATFVEGTQAEDFDQEREDKMLEEEEKSKPTELVGWGSWAGDGVKARPAPKKGKGAGKGKAKGKGTSQHSTPKPSHVQVYEGDAAVKAQSKYFVSGVPFPFKSPQQYDQDMRMPTGPEWNTLSGHLQRVKPKVFVKTGAIVAPLQYVKHLDPEQRESAINTWASAKQPKRLKARF
jgi:U3 small nucleolar RNA-associated protein 14